MSKFQKKSFKLWQIYSKRLADVKFLRKKSHWFSALIFDKTEDFALKLLNLQKSKFWLRKTKTQWENISRWFMKSTKTIQFLLSFPLIRKFTSLLNSLTRFREFKLFMTKRLSKFKKRMTFQTMSISRFKETSNQSQRCNQSSKNLKLKTISKMRKSNCLRTNWFKAKNFYNSKSKKSFRSLSKKTMKFKP